jgi:hypothetical protein
MSFATNSVSDAIRQLEVAVRGRCPEGRGPTGAETLRTPVALMFVRGDRGGPGDDMAKQVVNSYGYWNTESSRYLDLVFFGWWKEGDHVGFHHTSGPHASTIFADCCRELSGISKWRYTEKTDVLLVDFEMPVDEAGALGQGTFSFKNSIPLLVEDLVAAGKVTTLDAMVRELINEAKHVYDHSTAESPIFEVSDRIAWTRGRRSIWDSLKRVFLGDFANVYDELRPFAVCDLSLR